MEKYLVRAIGVEITEGVRGTPTEAERFLDIEL
jgi:hypothetical protein